jgi:hypothetical protein
MPRMVMVSTGSKLSRYEREIALRNRLAELAMMAALSGNPQFFALNNKDTIHLAAQRFYQLADAMIVASRTPIPAGKIRGKVVSDG